jgi:hypothetical protein
MLGWKVPLRGPLAVCLMQGCQAGNRTSVYHKHTGFQELAVAIRIDQAGDIHTSVSLLLALNH